MKKFHVTLLEKMITLTPYAWKKLTKISNTIADNNFVLNVTSNQSKGIYFDIMLLKNHNLKYEPELNKAKLSTEEPVNLYIDPIIVRLVNNIDIHYLDNDFENKFIYNVCYLDKGLNNCPDPDIPSFIDYCQDDIYKTTNNNFIPTNDFQKYYSFLNYNYKKTTNNDNLNFNNY